MNDTAWGLPDPYSQAGFYEDVPLKRLLAWLADTVLILVLTVLVIPFTAFTGLFFFPLLATAIGFAYRFLTLAGGSATLGMRLVSIEMRRADGQRFDTTTAFLHTLGYSVMFSFVLPQVASVVMMLTTARRQGLHDLVLGTAAINRAA